MYEFYFDEENMMRQSISSFLKFKIIKIIEKKWPKLPIEKHFLASDVCGVLWLSLFMPKLTMAD